MGGGPGVYSVWLAGRGYDVRLVDPVPLHVEQAGAAARDAGVAVEPPSATRGGWTIPTASADAVLLMGPLYHLTRRRTASRPWPRRAACCAPAAS